MATLVGWPTWAESVVQDPVAGNAPPVTDNDVITAYTISSVWVDVLGNDTDDADDLAICRYSNPDPSDVTVSIDRGGLAVWPQLYAPHGAYKIGSSAGCVGDLSVP